MKRIIFTMVFIAFGSIMLNAQDQDQLRDRDQDRLEIVTK